MISSNFQDIFTTKDVELTFFDVTPCGCAIAYRLKDGFVHEIFKMS